MGQRFLITRCYAHVEILSEGRKIFFSGRGEVPMKKFFFGVVAGVGTAVAAEDLGSVVRRIEADAEKVCLVV